MRMPGMKVRKIKPTICLRPGISKPKAASPISPRVANNSPRQNAKHFWICQSLGGVTY